MKICSICKVSKEASLSEFYPDKRVKTGLRAACKECERAKAIKWNRENPERVRENDAKWYRKNPRYHFLKTYGVPPEEYERLFVEQKGACAICKLGLPKLSIDHDHNTGKIRGLLCRKCNTGIGMLGDSFELLLKAASYIRKHLTN